MAMLIRLLAAFCVGTVLTQGIVLGYFAARGTLHGASLTKIIALVNGIDISGERLLRIMQKSDLSEQPDFDEILEARKMTSLDMDLRIRSQRNFENELTRMLADLKESQARFDQRREAFEVKLEEVRRGAMDEGLREVQRTMQAIEPAQAKILLMKIYDDQRIDDVVNIVQGIPIDKRKEILAEFVSPEDADRLHEILRRIGDGLPTTSLIDQARSGR